MRGNGKKRMWSDICGGGLKSEKGSFKLWSDRYMWWGLKSEKGSFLEASLQTNIIKIIPIIYIYIYILLFLINLLGFDHMVPNRDGFW